MVASVLRPSRAPRSSSLIVVDDFLNAKQFTYSARTHRDWSGTLRSFQRWLTAEERARGDLLRVSAEDIQAWFASKGNVKPSTIRAYYTPLKEFYEWCRINKRIKDNPIDKVDRPKAPKGKPHPLTQDELDFALLIASDDPRLHLWLLLGAHEGMRIAEIAALKAEDLDYTIKTLWVIAGKGDKDRLLPMNIDVEVALERWGVKSGPLFGVSPDHVGTTISRFLHGLDINHSAHSLRHYFLTTVYDLTKDIRLTQELAGHASPATTAIYTAVDVDLAFRTVRKMRQVA